MITTSSPSKMDQSNATPKSSKKRKRATPGNDKHDNKQSKGALNDSLKNLLTGKSDDKQSIVGKIDSDSNLASENKSVSSSEENVKEDKSVTEAEKPQKSPSEKVSDKSASTLKWPNELSPAHAKKIKVTVILERANLETIKHSKSSSGGVVLLNSDDHQHHLRKTGRDANDARPDITHQCLLALQDSPLNKSGQLKVYIRTAKGVLIDVNPQTRIPRTMKRFSGLMAELLEKFKVRGTNGGVTPLLKVIKNPITSHLPVGARKIVCTYNTENLMDTRQHAWNMSQLVLPDRNITDNSKPKISDDEIEINGKDINIVYVIGAMAHGKVTEDWADDYICVSDYPLSAATVCSRILYAYESMLGIM